MTFHISTPESKTKILLSIQIKCFPDLVKYGARQVLEREYGEYVTAVESGYDFSVLIDLEKLPEGKGGRWHLECVFSPNDIILTSRLQRSATLWR